MSQILSSKIVATRKGHDCFGCGRPFPTGTKMKFDVCLDAGTVFNTYLCKTCQDIVDKMEYGEDFGFGDLYDEALEIEKNKIILN